MRKSVAVLCFMAGVLSAVTLFFDPLYLQIIRGQSPQMSGILLFVIPVAVFVVAFFMGWLVEAIGILNTILVGLLIAALSASAQLFFGYDSAVSYIIVAFVGLGTMWAMGNTVSIIAAQTAVGIERSSAATGTMVTMFNIGGSIGLAIAIVIYNTVATKSLQHAKVLPIPLNDSQLLTLKRLMANPVEVIQMPMTHAMHDLFNHVFMDAFFAVMCFMSLLTGLMLLAVYTWKLGEAFRANSG